ncbi:MAG: zinc ribbon domain-containing protein [Lachnospiraceae bacterium]|nr:zinc ribbon domain-containing protein [Lachnospiraceae bacterium]
MKCKYCGRENPDGSIFCQYCGKKQTTEDAKEPLIQLSQPSPSADTPKNESLIVKATSWIKTHKPIVFGALAVLVIAVIVIVVSASGKCDYPGCKNKAVKGFDYCYSHKCAVADCPNSHTYSSNYCYSHSLVYDKDSSSSTDYLTGLLLTISDVKISSSSSRSYTYADGTITNNSTQTVKFVQIKGSFKDSKGNTIDTDSTYAVGAEGLAPGESCKWHMSVSYDSAITKCDVSVYSFK